MLLTPVDVVNQSNSPKLMATDPGFLDHVIGLFSDIGPIKTGRMFGGTSLYAEGAMFAVIFGDVVYMKSDDSLKTRYLTAGSSPFSYGTKTGTRIIPGLMSLPEDALEDPIEAIFWARLSLVPAQIAALKRSESKGNP